MGTLAWPGNQTAREAYNLDRESVKHISLLIQGPLTFPYSIKRTEKGEDDPTSHRNTNQADNPGLHHRYKHHQECHRPILLHPKCFNRVNQLKRKNFTK